MSTRRFMRNPYHRLVGPSDSRYRGVRSLTGPSDAARMARNAARAISARNELGFLDDMAGQELGAITDILGPIFGLLGGGGGGAATAPTGGGNILGSLLPMLAPVLGGLLGGGGGGGAGAAGAATAGGAGASGIAGSILQALPASIREQVRAVINEVRADGGTLADVGRQITTDVDARFQPAAREAVNALAVAQTQTDATQEHRAIVQDTERWTTNRDNQAAILARLDTIAARLQGGARVLSPRAVDILGPNLVDQVAPRSPA